MPVFPEDGYIALLPVDSFDRGSLISRCFDWERIIQLMDYGLYKDSQKCIRKFNGCLVPCLFTPFGKHPARILRACFAQNYPKMIAH